MARLICTCCFCESQLFHCCIFYFTQDGEDVNYRSHGYTGPRSQRDTEDPLAGEIMLSDTVEKQESSVVERLVTSLS